MSFDKDHALSPEEVASRAGLITEQVRHVYDDIECKRRAARSQHAGECCPVEGESR